jgi:hypothetical protein
LGKLGNDAVRPLLGRLDEVALDRRAQNTFDAGDLALGIVEHAARDGLQSPPAEIGHDPVDQGLQGRPDVGDPIGEQARMAALENAAGGRQADFMRPQRHRRMHDQRIAIQRQHRVVEGKAADGVPHLVAHQQEVAARIGMQLADVPLRRMGNEAVTRTVKTLQTRQQQVVGQFLEVPGGQRDVAAIATIERVLMQIAACDGGDDLVREVGIRGLGRDEAALRPAQPGVGGGGRVHAPLLRTDKLPVVLLPDNDAAHLDAAALRQGVQGLDDQGAVGRWVPLDEDQLGFDRRPLQLANEEAGRPPDSQVEIAGITVVAEVRDESSVWPGVHVELSRMIVRPLAVYGIRRPVVRISAGPRGAMLSRRFLHYLVKIG